MKNSFKWFCYAVSKVVDYQGRAGRKEAICYFFYQTLIIAILAVGGIWYPIVRYFCLMYMAVTLIPTMLVLIRRLHDMGCSGWWVFLAIWPPICYVVACLPSDGEKFNKYGTCERLESLDSHKQKPNITPDGIENFPPYPTKKGEEEEKKGGEAENPQKNK